MRSESDVNGNRPKTFCCLQLSRLACGFLCKQPHLFWISIHRTNTFYRIPFCVMPLEDRAWFQFEITDPSCVYCILESDGAPSDVKDLGHTVHPTPGSPGSDICYLRAPS
jgi:hypothetical protein